MAPGSPTGPRLLSSSTTTTSPAVTIDIAHQKARHEEQKRQYRSQAVEQALRQQLIEAIESEYLEAIRDPITYMIQQPIPNIFAFLQTTYGQITPQELADCENALKNISYDPSKPVDLIFNQITKFKELCDLCDNSKTDPQLVQLTYLIFNKTCMFTDALKEWNKLQASEKTYNKMKQHIRAHYWALKQAGTLTIEDSLLNDRTNLVKEISLQQEQLVADLKQDLTEQLKTNMVDAMLLLKQAPSIQETDTSMVTVESINSVSMVSTLQTHLTNMQALQNDIQTLKLQSKPNDKNINPCTGKQWKRYCWTCGCCPHSSKYCPTKAPGHQDYASFANHKGGATKIVDLTLPLDGQETQKL